MITSIGKLAQRYGAKPGVRVQTSELCSTEFQDSKGLHRETKTKQLFPKKKPEAYLIGGQWLSKRGTRGSGNLTHSEHCSHNLAACLKNTDNAEYIAASGSGPEPVATSDNCLNDRPYSLLNTS